MPDNKIKILIIDDDDVDRMAIKRALKLAGLDADVFNATDIETGTTLAFEEDFSCIFLDYNLPGNNGFDFLENYISKKGQAPVILVTSHANENLATEALKKGASDFICKSQLNADTISELLSRPADHKPLKKIKTNIEPAVALSNKIESLISNSPLIVFSIDENGIFNLIKGKGIKKLSSDTDKIIGKSIFETDDLFPVQAGDYKNALINNILCAFVNINERYYEVHYMPLKNSENNPAGTSGIVMDITDLKKEIQQLKRSLDTSEETQKIKETFLANMSHEVRTPIHGIINLIDILLKTHITEEQLKYLDAIKQSADILSVIINDILDLSKIEAQKMKFENAQFNLRDIVHCNLEIFKSRAEEKNLRLILNYDESLSEFLKGDAVRLNQVINNLLSNAVKFTHEGEIRLEVFIEEKNEKFCLVTFKVSDTGIGIPQHKLTSIFDSFSQAGDDITRKYGGTGLGLNICKKLVELQGGMITVESTLNKGSVFSFRLPFENIESEETISPGKTNNLAEVSFNKELKILVVEDNDINRMVINIMIRDWNFKADNATNGSIAIDMIEQNNY